MYCLDDYKNTSYKLTRNHLLAGLMNDNKHNPVTVAFRHVFDDKFYFECDERYLYVSQNENEYQDNKFDQVRLSFKMRELMRHFNRNFKVEPTIMCISSDLPGVDWLLMNQFGENWRNVYFNN